MRRTTDIDMNVTCKKFETALNRFFKKYPEHEDWRETFEWMYAEGVDFFCDNVFANGEANPDWRYALHLDVYDNGYYMALIERS